MIHHITPARSDKNFGLAINSIIDKLPDEDWVVLRDIDTVPLDHESFIIQCEKIAQRNEYGLVSCMTNRLGLVHQLIYGKMLHESLTNINKEIRMAKKLAEKHGSDVHPTSREVAGLMMMFPKKVWSEVGGFREGGIMFGSQMLDNVFFQAVKKKGYKVGIAPGIYLFHLYRWNKNRKNKNHLI